MCGFGWRSRKATEHVHCLLLVQADILFLILSYSVFSSAVPGTCNLLLGPSDLFSMAFVQPPRRIGHDACVVVLLSFAF